MNLLRRSAILLSLLAAAICSRAQELNCTVEFNTDQISGTNKSIFETLSSAVNDYMNTNTFTPAQFSANEKIDCRLFFTKGDTYIFNIKHRIFSPFLSSFVSFLYLFSHNTPKA